MTFGGPPAGLVAELPADVRAAFVRVFPTALSGPDPLRRQLAAHRDEIEAAAARNEFLDGAAARAISERLARLLDDWNAMPPAHRAVVQAAVAYYALRDDAEDDLDSVLGLEDDVAVVNACLRHLGLGTLVIAAP